MKTNQVDASDKNNQVTVKSIIKAIEILKTLSHGYRKLTDIAREVHYSKSTVHRLLRALKDTGMARQDPISEEYYPGNVIFELASNPFIAHQSLIYAAHPRMEDMRRLTGETVGLEIKSGIEQIRVHQLTGTHSVTYLGKPTIVELLLPGASGKALLSQVPDAELKEILDNIPLTKITPYTVIDKQLFQLEIAKVKERGFATSYDEVEVGVSALSVPVHNYIVPAAVTIIGPKDRLAPRIMDIADEVKRKAAEISEYLLIENQKK